MADMFPWLHGVFKLCQGGNAVLALNCDINLLNMISDIRLILSYPYPYPFVFVFIRLESYFKINHGVSKLSIEMLTIFQSFIQILQ